MGKALHTKSIKYTLACISVIIFLYDRISTSCTYLDSLVAHGDAIILQALSLTFTLFCYKRFFKKQVHSHNQPLYISREENFPFIRRLSINPFFALYNIKRDIKKRNTFLPLIMHSNITLMKKLQKTSPTIRTIYEICNLILRSDIVTKTKCAQKLLANICASRGPLLWVRAFLA